MLCKTCYGTRYHGGFPCYDCYGQTPYCCDDSGCVNLAPASVSEEKAEEKANDKSSNTGRAKHPKY